MVWKATALGLPPSLIDCFLASVGVAREGAFGEYDDDYWNHLPIETRVRMFCVYRKVVMV